MAASFLAVLIDWFSLLEVPSTIFLHDRTVPDSSDWTRLFKVLGLIASLGAAVLGVASQLPDFETVQVFSSGTLTLIAIAAAASVPYVLLASTLCRIRIANQHAVFILLAVVPPWAPILLTTAIFAEVYSGAIWIEIAAFWLVALLATINFVKWVKKVSPACSFFQVWLPVAGMVVLTAAVAWWII